MGCVRVWLRPRVFIRWREHLPSGRRHLGRGGNQFYLWGVSYLWPRSNACKRVRVTFPKLYLCLLTWRGCQLLVYIWRQPFPSCFLSFVFHEIHAWLSWWAVGLVQEVNGYFVLLIGTGISFFYFDGVSARLPSPRRWGRQRPLCETLGSYPQSRYVISLNLL